MKKLLCAVLLFMFKSSFAITPTCADSAGFGWQNGVFIRDVFYWAGDIKVCGLHNAQNINYSPQNLLVGGSVAKPYGKVIELSRPTVPNSISMNPISSSSITLLPQGINQESDIPVESFNNPQPFYLKQNSNSTNSNLGEKGIFRFYTRVLDPGGSSWGCDGNWESNGYSLIRREWMNKFFRKLKVNGKSVSGSNSAGAFAKAVDVKLSKNGSILKADVFFIEGRNKQEKYVSGFGNAMCMLDVYVKLVIKPNSSPNFNKSGSYDLKFTW
ncbi:MAG: hypothetical protein KGV50_04100 [Gammaproteobacteria bacterium]|nr:hypothetical protein [Gammaproteobacteria bacterium]